MKDKVIINSNAKDIAKFASLIPARTARFKKAPATPLPSTYAVNDTAEKLHPEVQKMVVKEVRDECADVKTYVLESCENKSLAFFRAGQYVSVSLKIGDSVLTRPYSLSSSPEEALGGIYTITVKRAQDGFASAYILDNWAVGTNVDVSAPDGTFYYEPLRDAETVVGIAGGSGITPFLSLAKAIADGTEKAKLVLLYGCRTENDIIFKAEFDKLAETCENITVVYVLSDSKAKGYAHGFVDAKLIGKYAPDKYSVFVCGPSAMYGFVSKELKKLDLPKKNIRFEMQAIAKPKEAADKEFDCVVVKRGEKVSIKCSGGEPILVALERAGIKAPSKCRCGECGYCRSKLVSGDVLIPEDSDGRRAADKRLGYIHPCCTYPKSDIEIKIF
ncbi:MAG: iron-sulfur cluster-binding domain-containing protein [Clostridiales bacterium]|nr:iron-sulfur cluster-binding domain-containing protein [Clostridiales bacterium]